MGDLVFCTHRTDWTRPPPSEQAGAETNRLLTDAITPRGPWPLGVTSIMPGRNGWPGGTTPSLRWPRL
jgi:hypothetical protein